MNHGTITRAIIVIALHCCPDAWGQTTDQKQESAVSPSDAAALKEETQKLKDRVKSLSSLVEAQERELQSLQKRHLAEGRIGVARKKFVDAFSDPKLGVEFTEDRADKKETVFVGRNAGGTVRLRLVGEEDTLTSALLVLSDRKDLEKTISNVRASVEFLRIIDPEWKDDEILGWLARALGAAEEFDVGVTIVRGSVRVTLAKTSSQFVVLLTRK